MSIPRRGLLAAGLVVALVSTVVVGTAGSAAAAPPLLPWGAPPHPHLGGTAAVFPPTGRAGVPPLPPVAEPVDGRHGVTYHYTVGRQIAAVDGVAAQLTVAQPRVDDTDWHSLAELAVQSADGHQVVEVGWTVDRRTNGDDDTHLFVYHWVDGKPTCYNRCGFVPYAGASILPGATLAVDVTKQFGILHYSGAWWIAFDSEWIGFFPDELWGGDYTRGGLVQAFGEVAASSTQPCTQLGNGTSAYTGGAARIGSVTYVNGPAVALDVSQTSGVYAAAQLSARTFRYGGPRAC